MARMIRILAWTGLALGLLACSILALAYFRRAVPESPLARAAAASDSAGVQALLEGGAPPKRTGERWSALVWAARAGKPESVEALVAAGADPDRRDGGPNGWTPLLHAVHKNQIAAVRSLLAAGADVNRAAPNGLTPLSLAAAQGEADVFEELLEAGADPSARSDGMTTLHHAILSNDPRVVEALMQRAPDLRLGDGWRDWAVRTFARVRGRSRLVARLDRISRNVQ